MKIRCTNPKHTDDTPSMEVYSDGAFCFSCGYTTNRVHDTKAIEKPKTNIKDQVEYIQGLPTKLIRGLQLSFDDEGYYLLWPNRSYYKKRLWDGKTRYIGPSGHRAPLFTIPGKSNDTVVIVEGEINSLSLSHAIGDKYTIVSPGSCNELSRHISIYLQYEVVYIIVDRDVAGVAHGHKLKQQLIKHGKRIHLVAKEKDYNQILQEEGPEGLKEEFYRDVGMP